MEGQRNGTVRDFFRDEEIATTIAFIKISPLRMKRRAICRRRMRQAIATQFLPAFFAYTGQSWWQAYDSKRSSPFREYNHEPELFLTWPSLARVGPWTLRSTSLGFVHQSNGRTDPVSRSWNRLFADVRLDHPSGWWLSLRPWVRIPERTKSDPAQAEGDDNPDIRRYLGDGELRFGYGGDQWRLGGLLRRSLVQGGKGAVQLDLTVPTGFSPLVRWYVQLFDGYGESLIDYNRRLLRVGFGLMLNDWY